MASSRSTSGEPEEYGFVMQHHDEVLWYGEFSIETLSYAGVTRFDDVFGFVMQHHHHPREHLVWAKDELQAYMRLMARRKNNV